EPVPTEPGNWPAFYAGVERSLRDGAAPPVDPADAVASLEVIEAARRSAASGSVVTLVEEARTSVSGSPGPRRGS
ncbi:MAG: hypothetical protein RRA92_10725, partial [Gemmatimonadota bacterium]|nr:hypothetical protein [Gemmatimonadota bacterium]